MANSDKNILITPSVGLSTNPTIKFNGANNTPTTLRVLDDGTVSFEGTAGQLFSISDGLTGSIFSVNDISGIPSIEVLDTGLVKINQYSGSTVFGSSAAIQNGSSVNAKVSISTVSATTPGLIIKSVASQSANLQEWQNSAGSILASLNQYGTLNVGGNLIVSTYTALGASTRGTEKLFVLSTSASEPVAVFKAAASQTADLQQWQNSAGSIVASINNVGGLYATSNSVFDGKLRVQAAGDYGAGLNVTTPSTTTQAIIARGAASQTANLQEWQDSGGGVWASVSLSGSRFGAVGSQGGTFIDQYGNLTVRSNSTVYGNSILSVSTANASSTGITIRGSASQTANLQEWQNSAGTTLSSIDSTGRFVSTIGYYTSGKISIGGASWSGGAGMLNIWSTSTSNPTLIIKGAASQTADLQQWQSSAGTALTNITSAGNLNIGSTTYDSAYASKAQISSTFYAMSSNAPIGGLYLLSSDAVAADIGGMVSFGGLYSGSSQTRWAAIGGLKDNATSNEYGGYLSLGTRTNGASGVTERMRISSVGNVLINGFTASTVGLTVKGAASQTANLQEWQNSSGTVIAKIDKDGNLTANNVRGSGAFNYVQTLGTKQTGISDASAALVSATITTVGYPVHIVVTGDAENNSAGGWARLQLYRDSTAIGNKIHVEGSAGSENIPFALQFIDTPSAGTYTYSIKTVDTAGGTFNFGETDGPTITVIELGK